MINWHQRFTEQSRWTAPLRQYIWQQTALTKTDHVLEIGCGTGAILSDISGSPAPHGLDIDLPRLREAQSHLRSARLACGDAMQLPFASQVFDVTFCHYLLLWVPNPVQVLLEMKRVTKPGGAVIAFAEPDYSQAIQTEWVALQSQSLQRQGATPNIGSRLGTLFNQAGIRIIENGMLTQNPDTAADVSSSRLELATLESDLAMIIPADQIPQTIERYMQAICKGEQTLIPTFFAWGR